jgi:hypothetical protein
MESFLTSGLIPDDTGGVWGASDDRDSLSDMGRTRWLGAVAEYGVADEGERRETQTVLMRWEEG